MKKHRATWSAWLALIVVAILAGRASAVFEQYEQLLATMQVGAGYGSVTVTVRHEWGSGQDLGLNNPVVPDGTPAFLRLYNNGVRVANVGIAWDIVRNGELFEDVIAGANLLPGTLEVKFVPGFTTHIPSTGNRSEAFVISVPSGGISSSNVPDPPPDPSPSPTPPVAPRAPDIQWVLPATASWGQNASFSMRCQQNVSIIARARDSTADQSSPVAYIEIWPVAGQWQPTESPRRTNSVSPTGDAILLGGYSYYIRYPLPVTGSGESFGYRFRAVAVSVNGLRGQEIELEVRGTEVPVTDQGTPVWNVYLINYATSDPREAVGYGGDDGMLGAAPRVRLFGGVAALGSTPRGSARGILEFTPDLDYVSGAKIPPLVPWALDLRIKRFSITADRSGQ